MALVVADRVKETTTTTGTGAITLAGAETNFVTFSSVLSNADTTYYAIVDNTNSAFEVGLGTYASSGNTITRTTIISSSNSNNAVDLQAGSKDVFVTLPSNKFPLLDASGNVDINGGTIDGTTIGGSTAAAGTFTTFTSTGIDDNATSTAITIDSSENVGIGTASPASLLELEGADPIITLDDTSAGGYAQVQALNGSLILMADEGASVNNSIVRFDVDGTERMRIDSSGNVGIGASSPSTFSNASELVVDTGTAGGITVVSDSTSGGYGALYFADGTTGDEQYRGFFQYNHNNSGTDEMLIGTAGTTRMTINSSGTVSVGGTGSGLLQLNGASSGNEGGQISLITASSLGTYSIDTYSDELRFLNGTSAGNYLWYTNSNAGIGMTLTGAGDLSVSGSVTTEGPDGGGVIREWPAAPSTYAMFGTANMGSSEYALLTDGTNTFIAGGAGGYVRIRYADNQTDKQIEVSSAGTTITGGAIDGATSDHFLLPNANNSESPNSSTSRNGGAINYIYNRSSNVTLTRGDFAHHIIQQWSYGPTFTLTSSTFQRGDIVEFVNVKGAVTITVVATIIYLPNGGNDTTLTLSQAGKFRLVRYSSNAGYWMVG